MSGADPIGQRTRAEPQAAAATPLPRALLLIGVVMAVVGSVGGPLITSVATTLHVSLAAAQWTLTVSLLTGAVATPVLGRLGSGARRRPVVLGTLGVIVVGSVLTVLPLPLGPLLVGRAAQGCGLALGPLMMASAREHLDKARAASTIAMISVASTAGVGFGYPLAGYLTDVGGIRLAYAAALGLSAVAFLVAFRFFPASQQPVAPAPDAAASLLLTAGVLVLLLVLGEASLWQDHLAVAVGGVVAALLLVAWTLRERALVNPLVDLRLLRHRAVAGANAAMLVAGVGMYLLLSCITRYVQTPRVAGYGFGLSTFTAGLFLVPFSVVGFVAGRLSPRVRRYLSAPALVTAATAVVIGAFALFAVARGSIAGPLVSMTLLGLGVGAFSAAMPAVILEVTPAQETASAMGVNQVVRSIGFSLGSTLSALLLAAHTPAGAVFPTDEGFTVTAWIGAAVTAIALGISFTLRPESEPER
ncbi:major facilitator superfamily MFS_1 [Catenulispora acidiphila DSM 44928]|uniref:Major facilitator superfamily MFS_1 n=1 Tax=Catenulispora acidiphila (strain DSM 44928 / JCM 14897 / NBRC 102108 / NRRL B-24433 / ID139908) TaxID=479433 RepID=C7PXY2_CATAD|nr:MFS transporter [Catenulispora acidiphila]ACU73442.1 major facilitator superfamily MFS_1 [Catenulispora acidiphila DSM 44928]